MPIEFTSNPTCTDQWENKTPVERKVPICTICIHCIPDSKLLNVSRVSCICSANNCGRHGQLLLQPPVWSPKFVEVLYHLLPYHCLELIICSLGTGIAASSTAAPRCQSFIDQVHVCCASFAAKLLKKTSKDKQRGRSDRILGKILDGESRSPPSERIPFVSCTDSTFKGEIGSPKRVQKD